MRSTDNEGLRRTLKRSKEKRLLFVKVGEAMEMVFEAIDVRDDVLIRLNN